MKNLNFEDYEDFACEITDKLESLQDELGNISVIAKYEEAKNLIKELLCIGYDIASIDLHKEDYEEYWDEYILGINSDEIWCEKFKRGDDYITAEATVIYVMDNCSSKVIPHCHSDLVYEVHVGEYEEECTDVDNDTNTSESIYVSRSKAALRLDLVKHGLLQKVV